MGYTRIKNCNFSRYICFCFSNKNKNIPTNTNNRIDNLSLENCSPFIPDITYGKVIRVYDGDTITLGTIVYGRNYSFQIRLARIDAPELRTKNEITKQAGYFVRDKLIDKILDKQIYLENIKYDKYGRILCEVIYDEIISHKREKTVKTKRINISDWLLENKYAVFYDGKKKDEIDWSYLLLKE